jgi:hypothetical protein
MWTKGDGKTFSSVESGSIDFSFVRVLKPGGAYWLQFNSCTYPTMNWKGRLLWNLVDRTVEADRSSRVRTGGRKLAAAIGMDGLAAGKTWRGAILNPLEVLEAVWESGGAVHAIQNWGMPMTWCLGTKCVATQE